LQFFVLCLSAASVFVYWPSIAHAATVTVNSTADGIPGACNAAECTLREAIVWANNNPGLDTILVPTGNYYLTLSGQDDVGLVGDLDIVDDLLIVGENALTSSVSGSSQDRVFDVQPNTTVVMRKIGVFSGDSLEGGGIRNRGDLSLVEMLITLNEASQGGGIYNEGPLRIDRSSIFSNEASGNGGGINAVGGPVVIVETRISSNTSSSGGGMSATGEPFEILIERSLISSNESQNVGGGGAVYVMSDGPAGPIVMTIRNSTVTGNTTINSSYPGDLRFNNPISVNFIHSTLTSTSPALIHAGLNSAGSLRFSNSILVGTCAGTSSAYASDGGNVESGGDTCGLGSGDLVDVSAGDLDLLPLMGNGGPTSTKGLGAGSVAIGFGLASSCVDQDQRTLMRDDGACDAGAFEVGAVTPSSIFANGFESGDTSAWPGRS
jgi:CSLREA domain-containing protein